MVTGKSPISVRAKEETAISPWVTLVKRTIVSPHHSTPQEFYSIRPPDYVVCLALTSDGRIPLVRQYRPPLERYSLELPGGLLEPGESPGQCAIRELQEETGFVASTAQDMGCLDADPGRVENRIWCFYLPNAKPSGPEWKPEADVERVVLTLAELKAAIVSGELCSAMHIALAAKAMFLGHFSF